MDSEEYSIFFGERHGTPITLSNLHIDNMPIMGSYVVAETHPDSGYILNLEPVFCDPNNIEYYTQADARKRWESRFNISNWGVIDTREATINMDNIDDGFYTHQHQMP